MHVFGFSSPSPQIKQTLKPSSSPWNLIIEVISGIARAIFYLFSAWFSPFFFAVGFVAGYIYSQEVRKRVTGIFEDINWTCIIPTAFILYSFFWPAAISIQGLLAGLDLGSHCRQAWTKQKKSVLKT